MALQLALPLEADSRKEAPLRQAWVRSGLSLPCELALQDRVIAGRTVEDMTKVKSLPNIS